MSSPTGPRSDESVEIRLVGLPVAVYLKAQQHNEELLRELQLIAQSLAEDPAKADALPVRLVRLVSELRDSYGTEVADAEARIDAAVDAGEERIDEVVFRVPRHAGHAARHLGELLDDADRYCAAGRYLVTLVTPPELHRFRHWYLAEFVRQAAGKPPVAWDDLTP